MEKSVNAISLAEIASCCVELSSMESLRTEAQRTTRAHMQTEELVGNGVGSFPVRQVFSFSGTLFISF